MESHQCMCPEDRLGEVKKKKIIEFRGNEKPSMITFISDMELKKNAYQINCVFHQEK